MIPERSKPWKNNLDLDIYELTRILNQDIRNATLRMDGNSHGRGVVRSSSGVRSVVDVRTPEAGCSVGLHTKLLHNRHIINVMTII